MEISFLVKAKSIVLLIMDFCQMPFRILFSWTQYLHVFAIMHNLPLNHEITL